MTGPTPPTDSGPDTFTARLQTAYEAPTGYTFRIPPPGPSFLARHRRPLVAAAAVALIAAGAGVTSQLLGGDDRSAPPVAGGPTQPRDTVPPGPTSSREPAATDPDDLLAEVYLDLDAVPGLVTFMVDLDTATSTVEVLLSAGIDGEPVRSAVEDDVTRAGYDLSVLEVGSEEMQQPEVEARLFTTLQQIAPLVEAPEYGLAETKIDIATNTVVVRRTTPTPAMDDAIRTIADNNGARVQIVTSRWSMEQLNQVGTMLNPNSELWQEDDDYALASADETPSGFVVYVTGNVAAARETLTDIDGVLAVFDHDLYGIGRWGSL